MKIITDTPHAPLAKAIRAHAKQQTIVNELKATIKCAEDRLSGLRAHLESGFETLDADIGKFVAEAIKRGDKLELPQALQSAKARRTHTVLDIELCRVWPAYAITDAACWQPRR